MPTVDWIPVHQLDGDAADGGRRCRSQLVAYYDENPVEVKGKLEIHQSPMSSAAGSRSVEGVIRTSLVYVRVPSEAGPFLVPFGDV